ncbi:MAG TPA: SDR family NAD(P)-dependent oxidoreductase [Burkholderiales bacterium]|nr:SDR family NAD(P)-dependent oxidoreductase [Burkholderiales bacterium]
MSGQTLLAGRVAIVTGGARGIGLAITEEMHRLGAAVVIADSGVTIAGDEPDVNVAAAVAEKLGASAAAFTDDIAVQGAAERATRLAVEKFGAVDIVVNNAAILRDAFIFKAARDNWERVITNNLTAAFALLAAATPLMREQQKAGRPPGRIVNIVSSAGLFGNFGQAAYASAKAGLVGLTRVVAMDMARSNVACNALAPFAATRVTDTIQPANDAQAAYKERALRIPAHYVARVAAFLASNGHDMNGQLFGVRGRELMLFSQPRPLAKVVMQEGAGWNPAELANAVQAGLGASLTDLGTDLEFFNTEPLV